MKRVLTNLFAFSGLALLMLSSCTKSDTLVTATSGKSGTLSASSTTLVLDKTKLTDTTKVIKFNFTQPNYGFAAAVTNTLQIDAAGDNWVHPTSVTLGPKVDAMGYSTSDFNALVLKLNLPAYVSSQVQVRVQHTLSSSVTPIYSNVVSLAVTPFNLISFLWVPGDYEGWNNAGGGLDSLVSPTGNGIYTSVINFPAGGTLQFKILPVKGSWTVAYGDAGGGTLTTSGGNITAPKAGVMLLTVNMNTTPATYTIVPADYYSVTGDAAGGWGVDTFMKYVNDGNGNWVVTMPLSSSGQFKIRQDAAWSNSWGTSSTAGVLTDASGGNISVAASGTHTVTFMMAPTPFGSPAVTLAPYTVTP